MFLDSPTRTKISLSGEWKYSTDGSEWNPVSVPSAYDWVGKIQFMRTFELKPSMLDQYTFSLVCYGINYQSEISINGNLVGRHLGGYASFVVQIPSSVLQTGSENTIIVSTDNELTPKTTLPLRQQVGGWRSYGGIFRDIYLLATPKLFIDDVSFNYTLSADGRYVTVQVKPEIQDHGLSEAENTQFGFQIESFLVGNDSALTRGSIATFRVQKNKPITVEATLQINEPKLWSPEFPDLYRLKCKIVRQEANELIPVDEYSFDAGFRQIRWTGGKLTVNNNPTTIKGIVWHEDHPNFGSAMTYDAMKRDVISIKSLGANLVRFVYPPHPYMIKLCDRYGLMVMEDIPLVGVPVEILLKDYFQELAVSYLKEMVGRDKYNPSVIAWGIGDDFETDPSGKCEYVSVARSIMKANDDRPIYFSTRKSNDPCFEFADIIAINSYETDPTILQSILWQAKSSNAGKPVILARFGKNIEAENRNGYSDPRSLEAQGHYIKQCFEVMGQSQIAGGVLWSFNDWRGDRPALTTHSANPYLQTMGIVGYNREKRVAFDVTRSLFVGEKVQALSFGKYAPSAPIIYVIAGLVVLIGFAFFYNGNRRFRECVNRALFRTYNFFADIRDQRIVAWTHTILLTFIYAITWAIIFSSIFTHYRESILLDNMLSQFMNDTVKEWFVQLIWNPPKFILIISLLITLKLVLLSGLVRLASLAVRTHVYFYHAFSVTMWSLLPFVILIPVAMILNRLMENPVYLYPAIALIIVVTLWVFLRLLKGVSIIYDVYAMKVYAGGIVFLAVWGIAVYAYFDYTQSTSIYLKYLLQSVKQAY